MIKNHAKLFSIISVPYSLFYSRLVEKYKGIIQENRGIFPGEVQSVADIGCGPGAFGMSFLESGFKRVIGVDFAPGMVRIARKNGLDALQADASSGIPLGDNEVDLAVAAYVAHGMGREQRLRMYREMSRIAGFGILLHDYNELGGVGTRFVERLEGGDYRGFLDSGRAELRDLFNTVREYPLSGGGSWYLCTDGLKN